VLRHQLEVSREQFWECIRAQRPVDRPIGLEEGPVELEAWMVAVLVGELHMTAEQIAALSEEEARRLVQEHWSRADVEADLACGVRRLLERTSFGIIPWWEVIA
jgi:hypothetical protein